jgi:hypothetical protein
LKKLITTAPVLA